MAVTEETPITSAVANGVTTVFPYAWTLLAASDLVVQATVGGVTTTYPSSAYTVSGLGLSTGSITFGSAPASGTIITIYRDTALVRETDYQDNGDLLADTVNLDMDRLWMAMQDILTGGKASPSAIRVPNGETVNYLPAAAARAGYYLGFDGAGEPALLSAASGTAASLASDLADTANSTNGDAKIGVKRIETGAAATTLHLWIQKSKFRAADFGVVADGVTNDHAAMTAAFAAIDANGGGELEIPIGTILLNTSALTIPENLTLTGQAWEVCKIKAGGAWTCLTKAYGAHTDYNRLNLVARNVRFIGAATALGGVYIDRGDNCLFEKCGFTDFQAAGAYGVYIKNTYWSHFVGCLFENIDTYGIQMAAEAGVGCNASTISGRCQFIGNNEPAFSGVLLNGQNLTVCMSDFSGTGNGLNGIVMENGEGIHIFDNYIERWQGQAIKATTGSLNRRIVVENSVLNSTGVPCLDFDHASVNDNIIVKNNRFPDMGGGQTCIDFGTSTNVNEFDNDEGTSNIVPSYTVSQVSNASYRSTFTGTLTGVSGTVTGTFRYEKIGKNVTLFLPALIGTSNATTCTVTGMPTIITPARQQFVLALQRDNTSTDFIGELRVENTGVLTLCRQVGSAGGFTAANNKGLLGTTISYSLD